MDKLLEKTSACNGTSPAKGGPVKSFQKLLLWCKMASTAALQVQVHEGGGLQRRQAGTAFADLLSAMEALPEAFLAGKSWIFIRELHLVHLWFHSSPVMLGC